MSSELNDKRVITLGPYDIQDLDPEIDQLRTKNALAVLNKVHSPTGRLKVYLLVKYTNFLQAVETAIRDHKHKMYRRINTWS